jgi:hypothetical protein
MASGAADPILIDNYKEQIAAQHDPRLKAALQKSDRRIPIISDRLARAGGVRRVYARMDERGGK